MEKQGCDPFIPPNPAPYLTDWLFEIGPSASGGMGGVLGWSDMARWSELVGVELSPWEARTLRRLSRSFLAQREDARKPACAEPAAEQVPREVQADKVSAQFKAMIGALGKG